MKKKTWLKKPWMLTLILILFSIIFSMFVSVLFGPDTSLNAITTLIAALLVGRIYGKTFKEMMPKDLKIKVSLYYVLFQLVLGLIVTSFIAELNLLIIGIFLAVMFIIFWVVYLMLGIGSRTFEVKK